MDLGVLGCRGHPLATTTKGSSAAFPLWLLGPYPRGRASGGDPGEGGDAATCPCHSIKKRTFGCTRKCTRSSKACATHTPTCPGLSRASAPGHSTSPGGAAPSGAQCRDYRPGSDNHGTVQSNSLPTPPLWQARGPHRSPLAWPPLPAPPRTHLGSGTGTLQNLIHHLPDVAAQQPEQEHPDLLISPRRGPGGLGLADHRDSGA